MSLSKTYLNKVIHGDALETLKKIPSTSVDSFIFSPPYWQLRDYRFKGQWGLEKTPEEYLENLWKLMDEIKRILKPKGTVWVNLGDTYGTQAGTAMGKKYITKTGKINHIENGSTLLKGNVPHKSLLLLPHRFAIGCMERGFLVRNDIVWAKPNGMPESVTDRFAKKHEYIFLLVKNKKYHFNLNAVRDPHKAISLHRAKYQVTLFGGDPNNPRGASSKGARNGGTLTTITLNPKGKNPGDVTDFWKISTKEPNEKHYATFNKDLITKPILAGCPKGGIILDPFCGVGTTGVRAIEFGRNFIGIEGKKLYARIAGKNIKQALKKHQYAKKKQ